MPIANITLITDAYRLANIIDSNEAPDAEQGQQGLRWLNDMMLNWQKDGIKLDQGWWVQDDLQAEAPLSDDNLWGVKFNLACLYCLLNGIEPLATVKEVAVSAYAELAKRSSLYMESDTTFLPLAAGENRFGWGPWWY
jgi:hypothetical protein